MSTLLRVFVAFCLSVSLAFPAASSAPAGLRSLVATHERLRSHFSAEDRQLLDDLCAHVRLALPRPARIPDDVRTILSRSMRGFTSEEISVLTDYVAGDPMIAAGADRRPPARLQSAGNAGPEMPVSYNLVYLTMQTAMQDESRRLSLLQNIMRTKHDTAKNSISNIR